MPSMADFFAVPEAEGACLYEEAWKETLDLTKCYGRNGISDRACGELNTYVWSK